MNKFKNLFLDAIESSSNGIFLIGEIKLASPTEGNLGKKSEILKRAKEYQKAGVDAISVVTEKHFFKGDPLYVKKIKEKVKIPILQKDFIFTMNQLYEAKRMGADAILLIAKFVNLSKLENLVKEAYRLGLEPVVEINDERDLQKAIKSGSQIIAVNARNLETFEINIDKACALLKKIPTKFIKLAFSGIKSFSEVKKYKNAGANGILVGTALMRTKNIKKFVKSLINYQVKVKICGIRTLDAALAAVSDGADFLGFNFVPQSLRFIEPSLALQIINKIRGKVKTVGVFQNEPVENVIRITRKLKLDFIQLHGKENAAYRNKLKVPVIKSIKVTDNPNKLNANYLLLDRQKQGQGPVVDLEKARQITKEHKIFLAGGLNPQNVAEVISKVRSFAVDVAGGIETDGRQDPEKIKAFIKRAKGALV